MSIIKEESVLYKIIDGVNNGRVCVIRDDKQGFTNLEEVKDPDGSIGVVTMDGNPNEIIQEKVVNLSSLEIPGWIDETVKTSYGYKKHLQRIGSGDNCLRTSNVVQPRVVKKGDILATGEKVVSEIRRGYNSSVLIELEKNGWVEVAPRTPIALGNRNNQTLMDRKYARTWRFAKPLSLREDDVLMVGDRVLADPYECNDGWVELLLTGGNNGHIIKVPMCIPIALLPWFAIRSVATFKLWRMAKKWRYSK